MGKKIRISDESVNCYGTRILTAGIDYTQYEKNPVLLYMHDRTNGVVGLVKNLHVENGELLGELEFDCASELSQRLKKQYEFGSMRMVSGNFQVLETSGKEELVEAGQTAQTITRCKLFEVSAVDIGGNDNALVLSTPDGESLSLKAGAEGHAALPLLSEERRVKSEELNINNNPLKKKTEMEVKTLALKLGLAATATEAEVTAKIETILLAAGEVAGLKAQVDTLKKQVEEDRKAQEQVKLAAITQAVETAIKEKRISAQMKNHFVELGKTVGVETLNVTLSSIQPQGKITATIHRTDGGMLHSESDYSGYEKLSAVPGNLMDDLVDNHQSEYLRLFKAEYGVEPAEL